MLNKSIKYCMGSCYLFLLRIHSISLNKHYPKRSITDSFNSLLLILSQQKNLWQGRISCTAMIWDLRYLQVRYSNRNVKILCSSSYDWQQAVHLSFMHSSVPTKMLIDVLLEPQSFINTIQTVCDTVFKRIHGVYNNAIWSNSNKTTTNFKSHSNNILLFIILLEYLIPF
jgi:hypothetical protein